MKSFKYFILSFLLFSVVAQAESTVSAAQLISSDVESVTLSKYVGESSNRVFYTIFAKVRANAVREKPLAFVKSKIDDYSIYQLSEVVTLNAQTGIPPKISPYQIVNMGEISKAYKDDNGDLNPVPEVTVNGIKAQLSN